MSVFAVPRSTARSREKSLYNPLNMERSEPWVAGERGAGRQQRRASDATRAGARLCPGAALEFERAHHSMPTPLAFCATHKAGISDAQVLTAVFPEAGVEVAAVAVTEAGGADRIKRLNAPLVALAGPGDPPSVARALVVHPSLRGSTGNRRKLWLKALEARMTPSPIRKSVFMAASAEERATCGRRASSTRARVCGTRPPGCRCPRAPADPRDPPWGAPASSSCARGYTRPTRCRSSRRHRKVRREPGWAPPSRSPSGSARRRGRAGPRRGCSQ